MLGDRLKELRGSGRTQEDVAKAVGVSRAAYSHFENNRNEPDNDTLKKLANFYGVSVDYLLGQNNTPKWATEKDSLDLKEVLEGNVQPSFNFGGEDITDDDRAKLNLAITQIFWEKLAKQRKKAERDGQ